MRMVINHTIIVLLPKCPIAAAGSYGHFPALRPDAPCLPLLSMLSKSCPVITSMLGLIQGGKLQWSPETPFLFWTTLLAMSTKCSFTHHCHSPLCMLNLGDVCTYGFSYRCQVAGRGGVHEAKSANNNWIHPELTTLLTTLSICKYQRDLPPGHSRYACDLL